MKDGIVSSTPEGTVQGSPLSPLLSNVVLDELDKELESRGIEFCRFADDCNLFAKTRRAARRIMDNTRKFIEKRLKLVVNEEKSKIALAKYVKFLGMTIIAGTIAISTISINRAMIKVKELIPRGTSQKIEEAMKQANEWYVGWSEYYKMTQYPAQLKKIEAHIRRRFRARLVDQQKSKRNLFKKLLKRGIKRKAAAKTVFSNRKRWALSHVGAVEVAFPNTWFINKIGQKIRSNEKHPHWFELDRWIKIT
jgi:hypothetical protein